MIRKFYKAKAIRLILVYPDKRVRTHWAIPNGHNVSVLSYSFIINEHDFFLMKGVPTYFFNINNAEPFNPLEPKKTFLTPSAYNTALNAQVATEIFKASENKFDVGLMSILMGVATIIVFGVVAYLGYGQIQIILEKLAEIRETLRLIGGL
jgi:hypothetical protein